jgi:calpain, invertebrate
MRFDDWKLHFNRLYVCKIFPETWSQFSVAGEWKGNSNGGPYPVGGDMEEKEESKNERKNKKDAGVRVHAIDTNDKWFNNPQYRLTVHKKTTVIISLMQEDINHKNIGKGKDYIAVNFMVVRVRSKKDRLWEVKPEDIVNK